MRLIGTLLVFGMFLGASCSSMPKSLDELKASVGGDCMNLADAKNHKDKKALEKCAAALKK